MQQTILSVILALAFNQPTSQSYAGTWTAELAGQTYVRLELQVTNGALGGRIGLGNIEVDSQGEVKTAVAAPNELSPSLRRRAAGFDASRSRGRTSTTPTISH